MGLFQLERHSNYKLLHKEHFDFGIANGLQKPFHKKCEKARLIQKTLGDKYGWKARTQQDQRKHTGKNKTVAILAQC